MADLNDIQAAIATNATGPKRVSVDGVSSEQHPIQDQIAAAQYTAGEDGASKPNRGLRFTKMIPAGPG
jgi:hypothetical protein